MKQKAEKERLFAWQAPCGTRTAMRPVMPAHYPRLLLGLADTMPHDEVQKEASIWVFSSRGSM